MKRTTGKMFYGLMLLCMLAPQLCEAQSQQQALVQAQWNPRLDSTGQTWDVQSNGYINSGTNNTFSSSFQLTVNRSSFSPNTHMMTVDGSELVLTRTSPMNGIMVTRRIKVDPKKPYIRYAEILHNPSSNPLTAQLQVQVRMGRGQFQTLVSDKGNPVAASLGQDDSGLLLWSQPQNQAQGVLLYLAEPKSKIKPAIQNQSNHYLTLTWNVPVPANKTATLVYFVAQKSLPTLPTGKQLSSLFKPFKSRDAVRDLPKNIVKSIVNMRSSGIGSWDPSQPLTSLASLGIEPSSADILAIGKQTALRGTVSYSNLEIETRYGTKPVSNGNLAAIARTGQVPGYGRVFLRDGDVLTGTIDAKDLKFTMNTGLAVDLGVDQIDRLVMRQGPASPVLRADITGILETMDGDRLVLVNGDPVVLEMVTPWGPRKIALDEVDRIESIENPIGYRVATRDGSRLFGFLSASTLAFTTSQFGVQEIHPSAIRTITMFQSTPDEEALDADSIAQPHVILKGENRIIGNVDLAHVHFLISGQRIPVPPHQLRNVHISDEGGLAPQFQGLLWDGGLVAGEFAELVLPVRQGDNVAMVPVRDIREIHVPSPTVPDALRAKIRLLIGDLGSSEFETRESASLELSELGQMPRAQLLETIRLSEDPEVRRRAETLIDELD